MSRSNLNFAFFVGQHQLSCALANGNELGLWRMNKNRGTSRILRKIKALEKIMK